MYQGRNVNNVRKGGTGCVFSHTIASFNCMGNGRLAWMDVSVYALNLADVQQSRVSPERTTTCGVTEFQAAHTDVALTTHPAGHLSWGGLQNGLIRHRVSSGSTCALDVAKVTKLTGYVTTLLSVLVLHTCTLISTDPKQSFHTKQSPTGGLLNLSRFSRVW